MISESMQQELAYFLAMVLYGAFTSACYHGLMLFRGLLRHVRAAVDAEDILFSAAAGVLFFLVAYERNDGILRWYAFFGAGVGCFIYVRTMGRPVEAARKWLLQKFGKTVRIRAKYSRKGRVSPDESSSPEHKSKRKKKKRS